MRAGRLRQRYAVIDLETTGIDPRVDRVVEMACVIVEDARVVDTWSSLVDPQRPIPPSVSRIHGLRAEHVRGAPAFEIAARELTARCVDARPVAHNAAFDCAFLPKVGTGRWLCTRMLAKRVVPEAPGFGNQKLRAFLGVDAEIRRPITPHRALDDALVTAHILIACLEREARERSRRQKGNQLELLSFALNALPVL